jgi:AraC-like DNA-binding protein
MNALTRLPAREVWARAGVGSRHDGVPSNAGPWDVDRDMHGRIEACDIGRVRLARIRVNPLYIEQARGAPSADKQDVYKILLQVSGRSLLQQAGREVMLSAGHWTLYKGGVPFALENLERSEQRMVILPRSELGGLLDMDAVTVRRFGERDRASKHLVSMLDSAFATVSEFGEDAASELAAAAIHLSRLALIENCSRPVQRDRSEVLRIRVREYIGRNLRDPGLSVAGIAAALNCSTRYLHKVFAEGDETLAQYILNRRLEKCFTELARVPGRYGTIAELAYSWGFRSLSHFGKAFSRRYGMRPGERRGLST